MPWVDPFTQYFGFFDDPYVVQSERRRLATDRLLTITKNDRCTLQPSSFYPSLRVRKPKSRPTRTRPATFQISQNSGSAAACITVAGVPGPVIVA